MVRSSKSVRLQCATLIVLLLITTPVAAVGSLTIPPDYTAVYKVLRNDRELAAVTIELSHSEDVWKLHGYSHDTRDLAKFLNIKGSQTTIGSWQDGRFIAENYAYSFSLIGVRQFWKASFDWQSQVVEIEDKHAKTSLPLDGFANDPFSLSLNLRVQLAAGLTEMSVRVVDEDKIEEHLYRIDARVKINTPLGCIDTTLLKRVREKSKRVSLGWYAQNKHFVPVRMQHRNKKGARLELLITALEIDGVPVEPTAACKDQPDSGKSVRKPSA